MEQYQLYLSILNHHLFFDLDFLAFEAFDFLLLERFLDPNLEPVLDILFDNFFEAFLAFLLACFLILDPPTEKFLTSPLQPLSHFKFFLTELFIYNLLSNFFLFIYLFFFENIFYYNFNIILKYIYYKEIIIYNGYTKVPNWFQRYLWYSRNTNKLNIRLNNLKKYILRFQFYNTQWDLRFKLFHIKYQFLI